MVNYEIKEKRKKKKKLINIVLLFYNLFEKNNRKTEEAEDSLFPCHRSHLCLENYRDTHLQQLW